MPVETWPLLEAAGERQSGQFRIAMFAAWHGAAFERMRKMPDYRDVVARMSRTKKRPPPLTPAGNASLLRMMQKAYGGTITETVH